VVGELVARKPLWKRRRASERDEELLQDLASGLGRWFATHACSAAMVRPKILVGGTDDAGRARIRAALDCAYEVVSAEDGLEAIAQADTRPPDLILLDGTTPRMHGHATCQALKADPRTDHHAHDLGGDGRSGPECRARRRCGRLHRHALRWGGAQEQSRLGAPQWERIVDTEGPDIVAVRYRERDWLNGFGAQSIG
jgi:CheY-like chemotaxis protein